MVDRYKAGDDKSFAMAYADFGKAMMRNPFTFQAVLDLAGGGVQMVYSLNNTYLSSYNLNMTTTGVPGRYTKAVMRDDYAVPGLSTNNTIGGATTLPSFGLH